MAEQKPELQWLARERYCLDRKSYAEVAGELDLAEKTVRDWAAKGNWRAEREALAEAEARIRINTVKCRAHVLQKLLDSGDGPDLSRLAAAAAELERQYRDQRAPIRTAADQLCLWPAAWERGSPAPQASAKSPRRSRHKEAQAQPGSVPPPDEAASALAQDADCGAMEELSAPERIRLLEQAVNRQLSYVLSRPVEDLSKRVKEIKAALDILESMKGRESDQSISVSFAD